jgi:hypothetical protein
MRDAVENLGREASIHRGIAPGIILPARDDYASLDDSLPGNKFILLPVAAEEELPAFTYGGRDIPGQHLPLFQRFEA